MSVSSSASLLLHLLLLLPVAYGSQKHLEAEVGNINGQMQSSKSCNIFQGSWVVDSYPLYDASTCPFVNPGLNCQKNGRPDHDYLKYRWKPNDCNLPRFDGQDFLDRYRGKKIMFLGDSLSSNQWQSLSCIIHNAVPVSNYTLVQKKPFFSLSFPECGVSIMFMKDGFLVDLVVENVGKVLKLDSISRDNQWKGIDILIFNSYHWWVHTGHLQTWDYFQVGDKIIKDMDHMEAYKIALTTWGKWVDANIDPTKTRVFFLGISAVHTEYLVTTFKAVPRGTEGAVSAEGTLAGVLASIVLSYVAFLMGLLNNDAVNVINISMGSILAVLIHQLVLRK